MRSSRTVHPHPISIPIPIPIPHNDYHHSRPGCIISTFSAITTSIFPRSSLTETPQPKIPVSCGFVYYGKRLCDGLISEGSKTLIIIRVRLSGIAIICTMFLSAAFAILGPKSTSNWLYTYTTMGFVMEFISAFQIAAVRLPTRGTESKQRPRKNRVGPRAAQVDGLYIMSHHILPPIPIPSLSHPHQNMP